MFQMINEVNLIPNPCAIPIVIGTPNLHPRCLETAHTKIDNINPAVASMASPTIIPAKNGGVSGTAYVARKKISGSAIAVMGESANATVVPGTPTVKDES